MGPYRIRLPDRQHGEPDISAGQLAEARELIRRLAIDELLDFDLDRIGAHQAEALINRLTDIWNGDLDLNRPMDLAGAGDTKRGSSVVVGVLLIALAFFAVLLLVANMHDA